MREELATETYWELQEAKAIRKEERELKNNPKIREELTAAGFLDDQIPSWVAKPLDTSKEVPEQLTPASTPTTAKARKMAGSGSQVGEAVNSGSQPGGSGQSSPPPGPMEVNTATR